VLQVCEGLGLPRRRIKPDLVIGEETTRSVGKYPPPPAEVRELADFQPQFLRHRQPPVPAHRHPNGDYVSVVAFRGEEPGNDDDDEDAAGHLAPAGSPTGRAEIAITANATGTALASARAESMTKPLPATPPAQPGQQTADMPSAT
jgi:hypothetical protein